MDCLLSFIVALFCSIVLSSSFTIIEAFRFPSPLLFIRRHNNHHRLLSSSSSSIRTSTTMASSSSSSSADAKPEDQQHVIIAGAGIIGTCTAYYLATQHNIRTTLVDPTGQVAPAASGKAGGFLALDWNDGTPTQQLTRRSFALHQTLADKLGADTIQYRRLECAAISVSNNINSSFQRPSGKKLQGIEWAESGSGMRMMGDERTIAQVHPKKLCERLWAETTEAVPGSKLVKGKVVSVIDDDSDSGGVQLDDGTTIQNADAILFACGPWTANIMKGVKYHSAIVPTDTVLKQCVFFSGCGDPEVYVRPDQTAYCTGFPDDAIAVTERPGEEEVRSDKIEMIVQSVHQASSSSATSDGALSKDPILEQACYLPTTNDGVPVMGLLSNNSNSKCKCYIATGHTCWGILLGPASGEAMANLIAAPTRAGGKTSSPPKDSVDLRYFDPSRYGDNIRLVP